MSLYRQNPERVGLSLLIVNGTNCDYLEVSHHDETGSTDPGGGQAGRVEDTVLVFLDHVSVTQQSDQHHWQRTEERGGHVSSYMQTVLQMFIVFQTFCNLTET